MKKKVRTIVTTLLMSVIFATASVRTTDIAPTKTTIVKEEPVAEEIKIEVKPIKPVMVSASIEPDVVEESPVVEEELLTQEEIELIALVTMAEAEGEPEEGQRLVIDTILNRVDSELSYFADTVHGVIYQKNAFSSVWNGRVDRCYVKEELCQLVREELQNRTNSNVLYFTAGNYGKYGTPAFSVANHYFSEA